MLSRSCGLRRCAVRVNDHGHVRNLLTMRAQNLTFRETRVAPRAFALRLCLAGAVGAFHRHRLLVWLPRRCCSALLAAIVFDISGLRPGAPPISDCRWRPARRVVISRRRYRGVVPRGPPGFPRPFCQLPKTRSGLEGPVFNSSPSRCFFSSAWEIGQLRRCCCRANDVCNPRLSFVAIIPVNRFCRWATGWPSAPRPQVFDRVIWSFCRCWPCDLPRNFIL